MSDDALGPIPPTPTDDARLPVGSEPERRVAHPRPAVRGVVEGFYGPPWSHGERLRMLSELGDWGMNAYLLAPKHDPFHRARWREPYPADELAAMAELAAAGRSAGVELIVALHPGLDMVHTDEADHAALGRKLRSLHAAGIRRFALLFDDIDLDDADPRDRDRWGDGQAGAGRAHGATCARVEAEVLAPLGLGGTLMVVPTDYAGSGRSAYRDGLDETLGAATPVLWTGDDVVVGRVTEQHVRDAVAAFGGRPLVLWDNFPVNDFDTSRAFLGPLVGRDAGLAGAGLHGILANPMVACEPSRFALHTVAAWARDPMGYDPATAGEAALVDVAGAEAEAVRPLVEAASSWPPSAAQHPALSAALDAALADGHPSPDLRRMLDDLHGLASLPAGSALTTALQPWAVAGARTADAIDVALAHRRGEADADAVLAAWDAVRAAPHGLARDAARAACEHVLAHELRPPDPQRMAPTAD